MLNCMPVQWINQWTAYLTCGGFCVGGTLDSMWRRLDTIWWTLSLALHLSKGGYLSQIPWSVSVLLVVMNLLKQHFSGEHRVMNVEPNFKKPDKRNWNREVYYARVLEEVLSRMPPGSTQQIKEKCREILRYSNQDISLY